MAAAIWTNVLVVALAEEPVVAKIGGQAVLIPAPKSFFRYDEQGTGIDVLKKQLAGSSRLLAAYSSREDLSAVMEGRLPKLERHFTATAEPELEEIELTAEMFQMLKPGLRKQFTDGIDRYPELIHEIETNWSAALPSLSAKFTGLKVGDFIPLGVFDETGNSICFSMLSKTELLQRDGSQAKYVAISAVSLMRVRDRMLGIACAAVFHEKSDIEWARQSLKLWRDEISLANNP